MKTLQRSFLLATAVLLVLALRGLQWEQQFEAQQRLFSQPTQGVFKVWVDEEPEVLLDHEAGGHGTGRKDGVYEPAVKEVRAVCQLISVDGQKTDPVKVRCSLRLSAQKPTPLLSYGDVLELEGKILPPFKAENPGQFDYAHYLKTKGVAYVAYLSAGQWHSVPGEAQGHFFWKWAYGLKRQAEETIHRVLPYPENALLTGILLGERSSLPEDMVESFFVTGTIHILAVSGMITAFVAGIFFMVLRVLRVPRKWAAGLTIPALLFFILMTGAHPPVCRAGLFSILALLALVFERKIRAGALLLTTVTILVFLDPIGIEDLSFQISFLATAGLMAMAPYFMRKLSFLPESIAWLVTASTAAQLAVWCLIIYDFNQFSLYSIVSNLVIVPLALFSAAGGLVLLAGSLVHPALGTLFGAGCYGPLKLLVSLTDWMGRWPGAQFIVASPSLGWVLLFHALLLALFFFYWPRPKPEAPSNAWLERMKWFQRGQRVTRILAFLFLLVSTVLWAVGHFKAQPLRVTFLAVGHGNAVVLRSPEGKIFIVDAGKEQKGPDRYQTVVAYLRHEGVQNVEGVLNTHPDEDHVGGLLNVVRAYPPACAYEGSRAQSDSTIYQLYESALIDKKVPVVKLDGGEKLDGLKPAQWDIVHPAQSYHPKIHADNNLSVVSLITYGRFHLLLPGDLEKPGIQELLKDNPSLKPLDWLMAPHHGRNSGQPMLCERGLDPSFTVLSDYRDYPDARDDYHSGGAVVLSTALDGAIEVEMSADGTGRYRTYNDPTWKSIRALRSL